jgi:transposase InsO family protein
MGYRMAWGTLRQDHAYKAVNVKRVHRLWKLLELSVPVKRSRKMKTGHEVLPKAGFPSDVWCLDFLHETALNDETIRILAVKDEFTRECIALEAASSFKAKDVASVLSQAFKERGAPKYLRSDNGPEFIAGTLSEFLATGNVEALRITPGSPWQNGFIESFNSRLRAELLDAQVFHNLADCQMHLRVYRKYYNEQRPHSALDYQTPGAFGARYLDSSRATPSKTQDNAGIELVGI